MRGMAVLWIPALAMCVWIGWANGPIPGTVIGSAIAGAAESTGDDLYTISPGSVDHPDIVWSKRIPVVNDTITISARVRGKGKHPVPVRFVLEAPGVPKTVFWASGSTKQEAEPDYVDYEAAWQPIKTGLYRLTVEVDPNSTADDSIIKNNTATVTLPVVWREIHIIPWGSPKRLKWITGVPGFFRPRGSTDLPELPYWKRRGIKVLGYMCTISRNLMKLSEEKMINGIVAKADQYSEAGAQGLIIDETGSFSTPAGFEFIRRFGVAYDTVREKYPHLKVYNWIAGPLHRQEIEIGARNDHIMMGECYEAIHARHGPTWRKRLAGYIERLGPRNIIAVGVGADCGRRFRPQIERSVQIIRELGPDMPGICYYQTRALEEGESYDGSFHEFLDSLSWDYFIKPVLIVREPSPQLSDAPPNPKEAMPLQITVQNIGGVPARNVGVKVYACDTKSRKRTLLSRTVIPDIGNGTRDIIEEETLSPTVGDKVLDGIKHPMGRFGKISRVLMDRVFVDAIWTPERAGKYVLEVELQPSNQYTILQGMARRTVSVRAKDAPEPKIEPMVAVTADDIWLSDYLPVRNQEVPLQVRVHNTSETPAKNVGVEIYARHLDTNARTVLANITIGEIGIDCPVIEEENTKSIEHKVINGTKYPIARYRNSNRTRVLRTRALIDAMWRPDQSGYYEIEVKLQPSGQYRIREGEGLAKRTIPVGG